jgi:hypothetical protein
MYCGQRFRSSFLCVPRCCLPLGIPTFADANQRFVVVFLFIRHSPPRGTGRAVLDMATILCRYLLPKFTGSYVRELKDTQIKLFNPPSSILPTSTKPSTRPTSLWLLLLLLLLRCCFGLSDCCRIKGRMSIFSFSISVLGPPGGQKGGRCLTKYDWGRGHFYPATLLLQSWSDLAPQYSQELGMG